MTPTSHRYFRYFTYIAPITKIPIVKNYGLPIFTIIILTIFILFAIKPTIETILVLQKKLTDSQQVLIKINQKANDLSEAKKNYLSLESTTKDKIQATIPTRVELNSIIRILEDIAVINDASISALQIQPVTIEQPSQNNKNQLSEISFTYNLEGPYDKLLNILQDVKMSKRLISLESLIFNKIPESSNILMSVSGKAFYLK